MSDAYLEIQHSRLLDEMVELKNKLANSLQLDFDIIRYNYELAKSNGNDAEVAVWRKFLILSCKDHEYEDLFEADGTFVGLICVNCTENDTLGEYQRIKTEVEHNCQTCKFKGGGSDSLFCDHPTVDTLEEIQLEHWMDNYFENSKNCPHWIGKI